MTNNQKIALVAGIVIIAVIGGFLWWQARQQSENPPEVFDGTPLPAMSTSTESASTSTAKAYTLAAVAAHKNAASCWSVIDGNVYDLTNWISMHPGGPQAILGLCGKDGSVAFHGQHDDDPKEANVLATMKIGALAK